MFVVTNDAECGAASIRCRSIVRCSVVLLCVMTFVISCEITFVKSYDVFFVMANGVLLELSFVRCSLRRLSLRSAWRTFMQSQVFAALARFCRITDACLVFCIDDIVRVGVYQIRCAIFATTYVNIVRYGDFQQVWPLFVSACNMDMSVSYVAAYDAGFIFGSVSYSD